MTSGEFPTHPSKEKRVRVSTSQLVLFLFALAAFFQLSFVLTSREWIHSQSTTAANLEADQIEAIIRTAFKELEKDDSISLEDPKKRYLREDRNSEKVRENLSAAVSLLEGLKTDVAEFKKKSNAPSKNIGALSTNVDKKGSAIEDSSTSSVIAMASGYDLRYYKLFVGSLRKTGYKGHIILGLAPGKQKEGVTEYLQEQGVIMKKLSFVDCTYPISEETKNSDNIHDKEMRTCAHPYPGIKLRWSRFPLARDWLQECKTCTGPALVMDFRDAYFQRDPFLGATVDGLQVFEENSQMRTDHWLVSWPVKDCKGVEFNEPMLCSGTTVGTREAMIKYLEAMYEEMKIWSADPKCRFDTNGDDQSMHNYLFYTGKLPFAKAIPNRMGIVNTVGVQAANIWEAHEKEGKGGSDTFHGANLDKDQWIGLEYDLTDKEGYLTNFDGSRSRVVHQYDRFGPPFRDRWLNKKFSA